MTNMGVKSLKARQHTINKRRVNPMDFIETPIKPVRVGKDIKQMSNKSTVTAEAKPAKKYSKTRGEHFKDLVIVALVVSIMAFIGGMQFAKGNQSQIDKAVSAVQPTAQAVAPEVKK